MAFITSHVEIAEQDRTINGIAVGKGQAFIVSDLEFAGGSGGAGGVDYVKIASFIGEEIQCFKMNEVFDKLTGTDMVTTAESATVTSAGTEWEAQDITEGDYIRLTNGSDAGPYRIATVGPGGDANALELECAMSATATAIEFEIIKEAKWEPDYAKVFRAYPEPGSPLWRYRPYLGPGDHVGCNLETTAGSSEVIAPGHNFGDEDNPVPTGAYIEIYQGGDAGRYRIITVKGNTLVLASSMDFEAQPGGIAYRVSLVSEHAATLTMVAYDGVNVMVGLHSDFAVKIQKVVVSINGAIAFDDARGLDNTDAQDLFNKFGSYLGCYRLKAEDDSWPPPPPHPQGGYFPVKDERVIIMAKPWRGRIDPETEGEFTWQADPRGPLFFNEFADPHFRGHFLEPVLILSWVGNHYRLKWAVGEAVMFEPPLGNICTFMP